MRSSLFLVELRFLSGCESGSHVLFDANTIVERLVLWQGTISKTVGEVPQLPAPQHGLRAEDPSTLAVALSTYSR